jgi:host factor-I protein
VPSVFRVFRPNRFFSWPGPRPGSDSSVTTRGLERFRPEKAIRGSAERLKFTVLCEVGASYMSDNKWNALQDSYLNDLRKQRMSVWIYLVNGIRQQGHIESFDVHTILLRTGSSNVLVYKHAVATVLPAPKALAEVKAGSSPIRADVSTGPVAAPVIIRKASPRRIIGGTDDREGTARLAHRKGSPT